MIVNKIHVENFKSFKEATFNLDRLNVILGMNASGKSNFTSILSFLSDFEQHGLENAIALQGGAKFLTNINIKTKQPVIISVSATPKTGEIIVDKPEMIAIRTNSMEYKLTIDFKIENIPRLTEKVTQEVTFVLLNTKERTEQTLGTGKIEYVVDDGKQFKHNIEIPKTVKDLYKIEDEMLFKRADSVYKNLKNIKKRVYIIQTPILFNGSVLDFVEFVQSLTIYDIDPKQSKKSVQIVGKSELEPDGSNLPLVLNKILETKNDEEKLTKLLKQLLPFISTIDIEKQPDNSLYFKILETYQNSKDSLPSLLLSDGTINITALIIAMFFEDKDFLCFEEPERNIHPHLLANLLSMMKDVSMQKQIIITTHNPEIVRHVELSDLIIIKRDQNGFSQVIEPDKHEQINTFLENDIGMADIFVDNLIFD